jgi:hypothetical protein
VPAPPGRYELADIARFGGARADLDLERVAPLVTVGAASMFAHALCDAYRYGGGATMRAVVAKRGGPMGIGRSDEQVEGNTISFHTM